MSVKPIVNTMFAATLGIMLISAGGYGIYHTVKEATPENRKNVSAFKRWCFDSGYRTFSKDIGWVPPRHKCLLPDGDEVFYAYDWKPPEP